MDENLFFCQTLIVAKRHAATDEARDAVQVLIDRFSVSEEPRIEQKDK